MKTSKISQDESRIRQGEIVKRIRKGWSHSKIIEWVMDTYSLSKSYSYKLVSDVFAELAESADVVIQNAKTMQIERLEDLLMESLKSQDKKTAMKTLDMLNKIYGLYIQKSELNVTGENISFKLE